MKLNGVPIFHKNNLPLLVFIVLTLMYLVKSEQINLLFVIVPLLYIFRERLSDLYIQEAFPEKNTTVVSEGSLKKVSFSLSPTLSRVVSKLRSYRVYSPPNYRKGKQYLKMFNTTMNDLSRTQVYNSKQLFHNAEEYLRLSLNHFQAISFSVPEPNYTHVLKNNVSASTKARQRIGILCQRLHEACYHILYNYSHKYDLEFREKPTIYSGEIAYSSDNITEGNRYLANELH
jgi:hypothetical protein